MSTSANRQSTNKITNVLKLNPINLLSVILFSFVRCYLLTSRPHLFSYTVYRFKNIFCNDFFFTPFSLDSVDYDTFQRVMLHFLVKKAKKESNEFAHKNVIGLTDFETPWDKHLLQPSKKISNLFGSCHHA